jgi:hypothetical protein
MSIMANVPKNDCDRKSDVRTVLCQRTEIAFVDNTSAMQITMPSV